ncbi:hypothetical protein ACFE04_009349 [Oxalis oulophora]
MEHSRDDDVANSTTNWRKQVDVNVKRLQSLLFGADQFLEKGDFSSARLLALQLIGFLDSQSYSDDLAENYTRPIRRQAAAILDTARRALLQKSNRRAFQQAGRDPGNVFVMKGGIDEIKQSKFFQALVKQYEGDTMYETKDKMDHKEKIKCNEPKGYTQAKLTDLYGKSITRLRTEPSKSFLAPVKDTEDCMIVEKAHSHLGTKRAHLEISSPRIDSGKSPSCNEEAIDDVSGNGFVTARAKMEMDVRKKHGFVGSSSPASPQCDNSLRNKGYGSRSYGFPRRSGLRGNFVPPIKTNGNDVGNLTSRITRKGDDALDDSTRACLELLCGPDGELPEKLRNLEPRLIEHVSNEIMDRDPNVRWDDIAGLEHAKKCVTEMVIYPLLRPDIFKGCRSPGRGLLLFGPPGTGKTMIGKAIAGEAKATFFYISASSLTSKWIGEGEKLVRALFGVASCRQPAVIFVDEVDSLLSQRKSDGEHESSRRLKTQFLIEMEGFDSGNEQILLIGATNRPQELDEAARRRLTKRLYIPLPSSEARAWIIRNLLEKDGLFNLSKEDIDAACKLTEGYSGSDMKNLVKDASMGPLREALKHGIQITNLKKEDMRPVTLKDFEDALQEVRPSVSLNELGVYDEWNKQFGSLSL